MTRLLTKAHKPVVLLTLFAFCCAVCAQQPSQGQPSNVYQGDEIIRISTDLAQIDLTVLDKQGRFVDGLRSEQFQLLIDGKPQAISFFEQLRAGSEQETQLARARADQRTTAEEASTLTSSTADRGRTIFFFVDDLHLSPASVGRTRDLLLNYVDDMMGPKDQAVITTATGQLGFLQQLTGDHGVLHRAIQRLTYRASTVSDTITSPAMNEYQATAIENGDRDALSYFIDKQCDEFKRMGRGVCATDAGMTNNAVYDDAIARSARGGTTSGTSPGPVSTDSGGSGRTRTMNNLRPEAERFVRSRARTIARQAAQVALNTLASLESLIRSASSLTERKLVIFISDGFFINYLTSTNTYDMRRITDAALRTGTVIYTVDARGLVTGVPDASTKSGFDPQGRYTRISMGEVTAAQDPLNSLADDTGGRAYRNSNDLAGGVVQALRETSAYYLIVWRPEPGEAKDRFRRIEIRVKDRPDLTVRMRKGFFEVAGTTANGNKGSGPVATVEEELLSIIRSSYPKHSLPTTLSVGYMYEPDKGMSVMASMAIETATGNLNMQASEVDIMGAVVNEKGDVISTLQQHLTSPSSEGGRLLYTMQFPNLVSGIYQVRLATRSSQQGLTGDTRQWIESPDTSKGQFLLGTLFLSEQPLVIIAIRSGEFDFHPSSPGQPSVVISGSFPIFRIFIVITRGSRRG